MVLPQPQKKVVSVFANIQPTKEPTATYSMSRETPPAHSMPYANMGNQQMFPCSTPQGGFMPPMYPLGLPHPPAYAQFVHQPHPQYSAAANDAQPIRPATGSYNRPTDISVDGQAPDSDSDSAHICIFPITAYRYENS